MPANIVAIAYVGAAILFILSLGGLSNPETSRRGNLFGIIGMTIAVLATVFGPRVTAAGIPWIVGSLLVGGSIGLYAAKKVQMTQMPELVALMHSLVGLAAMLVGYANYIDPAVSVSLTPAERAIHEIEMYVGVLIGAVTFSGSVIAFGKLSGRIGGKPVLLPARHWINLIGLLVVVYFGYRFVTAHGVADGMTPMIVMTGPERSTLASREGRSASVPWKRRAPVRLAFSTTATAVSGERPAAIKRPATSAATERPM